MQAVLRAVDCSVPARRMANEEFTTFLETTDEWIYSHTGIRNRHIADPEQATSDLAIEASRGALQKAGVPAEDLDLVIVATATGDFPGFPSVACIVQDKLGAKKAGAFDLAAGCTGFIYGLETARAFLQSGAARHVLVVGADILSRIVNWQDRNTCVLFGDGAGAAVLSAVDGPSNGAASRGVLTSMLRADGGGASLLQRAMGGTRQPYNVENYDPLGSCIHMEGRQVYNFAVKAVAEGIPELMTQAGVCLDQVAWFVPHQANVRIIEAAAKRSGIPLAKFYLNIEEYANTSAASIPIAMTEMQSKDLLHPGDLVVTFGFGAGLTWGGNVLRW